MDDVPHPHEKESRLKELKVEDKIPDFSLPDQEGKMFHLRDVLGKKNLVIYFYPKDDTPGCTAEACTFRDQYEDFAKEDALVIGISGDSAQSHKKFASKHRLPFTLLSDGDGEVRQSFGAPSSLLGLLPGRVTYVVDKEGIVRHVFNSLLKATQHVDEALKILRDLP